MTDGPVNDQPYLSTTIISAAYLNPRPTGPYARDTLLAFPRNGGAIIRVSSGHLQDVTAAWFDAAALDRIIARLQAVRADLEPSPPTA